MVRLAARLLLAQQILLGLRVLAKLPQTSDLLGADACASLEDGCDDSLPTEDMQFLQVASESAQPFDLNDQRLLLEAEAESEVHRLHQLREEAGNARADEPSIARLDPSELSALNAQPPETGVQKLLRDLEDNRRQRGVRTSEAGGLEASAALQSALLQTGDHLALSAQPPESGVQKLLHDLEDNRRQGGFGTSEAGGMEASAALQSALLQAVDHLALSAQPRENDVQRLLRDLGDSRRQRGVGAAEAGGTEASAALQSALLQAVDHLATTLKVVSNVSTTTAPQALQADHRADTNVLMPVLVVIVSVLLFLCLWFLEVCGATTSTRLKVIVAAFLVYADVGFFALWASGLTEKSFPQGLVHVFFTSLFVIPLSLFLWTGFARVQELNAKVLRMERLLRAGAAGQDPMQSLQPAAASAAPAAEVAENRDPFMVAGLEDSGNEAGCFSCGGNQRSSKTKQPTP